MSIILLALKTKEFILPRWMWRLQYNTSIGTSFCIEASVKAQRSSKIRPWNFLRHRPYRPAPHITRTMASRYDPPSPSILFCRSKLDERQTRSTFPTKNWRQRFGGLARCGTLAVETNNSRNLVISPPIKPLRPTAVLLCKSWTISEYWQMRQRLPGTFPAGNVESAFFHPRQPKTKSRLCKNIFKSRFRVVPPFFFTMTFKILTNY